MKFTFAAALFAVVSGAAPAEAHSSPKLLADYLRGGVNHTASARRLTHCGWSINKHYPDEYDCDTSCLSPAFEDKCANLRSDVGELGQWLGDGCWQRLGQ